MSIRFTFFALLVLQGCTTAPIYYKQYTGGAPIGAVPSTLSGVSILGPLGVCCVTPYIIRVNDMYCKSGESKCEGIEIIPGKYQIKIGVENYRFYSTATFDFVAVEAKKYIIKSEEVKPDIHKPLNTENIWLIDATDNTRIMKIEGWKSEKKEYYSILKKVGI